MSELLNLVAKDSMGNCDFLFHDLHILDNPQVALDVKVILTVACIFH
jgi:hypothetical protein